MSYVKLLGEGWIRLVVHGQQLFGDEAQVGERAVCQHHQHLVGCQPAAGCAAPERFIYFYCHFYPETFSALSSKTYSNKKLEQK